MPFAGLDNSLVATGTLNILPIPRDIHLAAYWNLSGYCGALLLTIYSSLSQSSVTGKGRYKMEARKIRLLILISLISRTDGECQPIYTGSQVSLVYQFVPHSTIIINYAYISLNVLMIIMNIIVIMLCIHVFSYIHLQANNIVDSVEIVAYFYVSILWCLYFIFILIRL